MGDSQPVAKGGWWGTLPAQLNGVSKGGEKGGNCAVEQQQWKHFPVFGVGGRHQGVKGKLGSRVKTLTSVK